MILSLTNFPPVGARLRELGGLNLPAQLRRVRWDWKFKRALRRWLSENPEWLPRPIGEMSLREQLIRAYSICDYVVNRPELLAMQHEAEALHVLAANWPEIKAWLEAKVARASEALAEYTDITEDGGEGTCESGDNAEIARLLRAAEAATGQKLELA